VQLGQCQPDPQHNLISREQALGQMLVQHHLVQVARQVLQVKVARLLSLDPVKVARLLSLVPVLELGLEQLEQGPGELELGPEQLEQDLEQDPLQQPHLITATWE